jgi:threonine synthase
VSHYQTVCLECQAVQSNPATFVCTQCGGLLGFRYDETNVQWDDRFGRSMWRYWRMLPIDVSAETILEELVTLEEGGTPLLRSRAFPQIQLYLKDETRNPTGSHKDRPLSIAINHARRIGADVSFVVSTGSTGISNAALAARAGLKSVTIMTTETPAQRVYPMFALGSTILEVKGAIDAVIEEVITVCRAEGLYLSSTSRGSNPYQAEGTKTIAYELVEDLGRAPDWVIVPVGGGGTIAGILRGFQDLQRLGQISSVPRLVGVLPRDYNILEVACAQGIETWDELMLLDYDDRPHSLLVKLAHSYPPDGLEAMEAVRESGGFFISVTDEEAIIAQEKCGRTEGIYVEASSGACIAGVERLLAADQIRPDETVVALVSGSGFRETFATMIQRPLRKRSLRSEELRSALIETAEQIKSNE